MIVIIIICITPLTYIWLNTTNNYGSSDDNSINTFCSWDDTVRLTECNNPLSTYQSRLTHLNLYTDKESGTQDLSHWKTIRCASHVR